MIKRIQQTTLGFFLLGIFGVLIAISGELMIHYNQISKQEYTIVFLQRTIPISDSLLQIILIMFSLFAIITAPTIHYVLIASKCNHVAFPRLYNLSFQLIGFGFLLIFYSIFIERSIFSFDFQIIGLYILISSVILVSIIILVIIKLIIENKTFIIKFISFIAYFILLSFGFLTGLVILIIIINNII